MNGYKELYRECRLCPRECGVDRIAGQRGFCGETDRIRIAWAGLHRGEEPPVTGDSGSGTIFFTGCTLRCSFCQNQQLSRNRTGGEVSPRDLASIMLKLETAGAENINLVTGTHFIPGILEALDLARNEGLSLPAVWNSSGYERREVMELIARHIACWLPDMKTPDSGLADRLFKAADYPRHAAESLEFMAGSGVAGIPWEDGNVGMIVRHLVLPGEIESTRKVLEWYSDLNMRIGDMDGADGKTGLLLSLMTQYTPVRGAGESAPGRMLTGEEAEKVYEMLDELSIEEGFFQEPPEDAGGKSAADSAGDSWEPDFNRPNPFPDGWAERVWHFRDV